MYYYFDMLESEIGICKDVFDKYTGSQKESAEELQFEYYMHYRQAQEILRHIKSYIMPAEKRDD